MHWHHRTILHKMTDPKDSWLSVHEFFHEKGKYTGFTFSPASPRSKKEAKWILEAFSRPPAVEVKEDTAYIDDFGFTDYKKWKWIIKVTGKAIQCPKERVGNQLRVKKVKP